MSKVQDRTRTTGKPRRRRNVTSRDVQSGRRRASATGPVSSMSTTATPTYAATETYTFRRFASRKKPTMPLGPGFVMTMDLGELPPAVRRGGKGNRAMKHHGPVNVSS
jgi:hypothetical protein